MLIQKQKFKKAGGVAQVVEHLPSKHEAVSQKPSIAQKCE
jgi:hypothetical protein